MYDTAFDPSLLAYFRRRLARSHRPNRIFETVRNVVQATGVLTLYEPPCPDLQPREAVGRNSKHDAWYLP